MIDQKDLFLEDLLATFNTQVVALKAKLANDFVGSLSAKDVASFEAMCRDRCDAAIEKYHAKLATYRGPGIPIEGNVAVYMSSAKTELEAFFKRSARDIHSFQLDCMKILA
jgi:hypothetical protein